MPTYNIDMDEGNVDKFKEMDKFDHKFNHCHSPSHNFPTLLYIPPGQRYTHTCPSCGKSITIVGREMTC